MKKIAYYPGCSLEGLASEYELSTHAVCRELGIDLFPIPDWNCCGSSPAHSLDPMLSAALSGRNLAIAADHGCEVVMTPCPGCLKSLKGSLKAYHDENRRESFLEVLGRPFDDRIKPVSVLQLLYEEVGVEAIRSRVTHPLEGQVIAPYYGCLLSRPPESAQFDDPENPVSMDRILEALGATVPDFPFKTECCGATSGVTKNEVVGRLSGRILDMAQSLGATAVAVACPLCQQNLDLRQGQVNRHWKRTFDLPVVYITQLIGLALGIEPKKLGVNKLFVNAESIIPKPAVEENTDGAAAQ